MFINGIPFVIKFRFNFNTSSAESAIFTATQN